MSCCLFSHLKLVSISVWSNLGVMQPNYGLGVSHCGIIVEFFGWLALMIILVTYIGVLEKI
jgi:hypothetical protein